jgi:hypothetical protein
LIAVFSGPLLRQAEGALDLTRSLAELGCPPLVEELDGGVGDDAGSTILSSRIGAPAGGHDSIRLTVAATEFFGPWDLILPIELVPGRSGWHRLHCQLEPRRRPSLSQVLLC